MTQWINIIRGSTADITTSICRTTTKCEHWMTLCEIVFMIDINLLEVEVKGGEQPLK